MFTMRNLMHEKMQQMHCQMHKEVSLLQLITLKFIKQKKPFMKDISEFLSITPPSATSLIDNLIKGELVKRKVDSKDKRITKIIITQKGGQYIKKFEREMLKKINQNLSTLNGTEQKQLIKILEKIIKANK